MVGHASQVPEAHWTTGRPDEIVLQAESNLQGIHLTQIAINEMQIVSIVIMQNAVANLITSAILCNITSYVKSYKYDTHKGLSWKF